ncbi:proton-conducting transporter transmembrane domain-containing protein [Larkinella ripae]
MQSNLLEITGLSLTITIDSLSAFFLTIISLTFLTGTLYAHGYLQLYRQTRSDGQFSRHHLALLWLHISLILVSTLREGTAFLIVWELMVISAFGLVMFEGERKGILKTGLTYLVQMQTGFALIAAAFLVVRADGQPFGFDGLGIYFSHHNLLPLFLLLFVGFGIYAGFMPLHTWLPPTHLAAPSHVSGIMSGALLPIGLYGILRVLTYVHRDLIAVGCVILVVSLLSGIVGIRAAFVQQDGKSLLAYSSVSNTGIVGIGLGAGLLGMAFNLPTLAALGLTGSIIHIASHALSKSLLFYSIGSVYRATHTRNLDQLGGLLDVMPKTAIAFLIGLLGILALPPFNGFISGLLMYSGLFKSFPSATGSVDLLLAAIILGLLLISVLSLIVFSRTFNTVFLGRARSMAAAQAKEVSDDMSMPKMLAGFCILAIGLFPVLFLKITAQVTALYVADLTSLSELTSPLAYLGIAGTALVGLVLLALWLRNRHQKPLKFDYHQNNAFGKPKREHWFG